MSCLYFVRHGLSVANLDHRFANRGAGPGLTEQGRAQAAERAQQWQDLRIEVIHSSPLLRALQTARILADRLGVPVQAAEALREYDVGAYEGTTDPAHWREHAATEDAWLLRGELDRRVGGGESYRDLERRFVPFVEQLAATGQRTVLVSHAGLLRAMLPRVLPDISPAFSHAHPLGHLGYVLACPDGAGLRCRDWDGRPYPTD
jgi:probable phosphoglycerate mutase